MQKHMISPEEQTKDVYLYFVCQNTKMPNAATKEFVFINDPLFLAATMSSKPNILKPTKYIAQIPIPTHQPTHSQSACPDG
jgi:hypothetical protein